MSAGQFNRVQFSLVHSSSTDNLKLIKNKPHKNLLKTPLKLDTELDHFEINQTRLNAATILA